MVGNANKNFILLLGFCAVAWCIRWVYIRLTNPLNRVPGDWHTKFSSVFSEIQRVTAKRVPHIHELHQIHGPIVRVGLNAVDIVSLDAVRTIYSTRETFIKHQQFYSALVDRKKESVFSTADVNLHRRHRRLLGASLTESSLRNFEDLVQEKIAMAMQHMKKESSQRGCVDVLKWWMFFTTDVISELSFGEPFGMLSIGKPTQYSEDLEHNAVANGVRIAFPLVYKLLNMIPLIHIPNVTDTASLSLRMRSYAEDAIARHKHKLITQPSTARPSLLSKLLADEGKDEKTGLTISYEDLVTNAQSYIIAGTDTTALSLTYLVWEVCRNYRIRDKLVTELRTINREQDSDGTLHDDDLRPIQYLNYIIEETLRLHPAVAAGLPRVVPSGGVTLGGYFLPGGTVVTSQGYTVGRNPHIFPQPEEFRPERWENATRDMRDSIMAFGSGSRVCLGMHLAKMEMRQAVANFFLAFPDSSMSKLEGMNDEDMGKRIFFLLQPIGKRCLVDAK